MKLIKWFYFLSKRLYKKWMFILLIFLVPVSVLALKITSNQKSGFVQIGIVNLASDTGEHIVDNLDGDKGIVTYTLYDTTDHAITELEADKLDAIWILPPNIEQRIADYVEHPNRDHYIIDVIKKEESLKTRLALETLSGAIYPFISRPFFLKCIRENTDFNVDHLTDEQIYKYYDDYFNEEDIFKFSYPDDNISAKTNERNYMTSPIRGLLSAVILLSGLAAAMLYVSDEKKGVFSFVKNSQRLLLSLAFELTAVINIGFFVLCSVFVLDVNTYWGRELAIFLILVINTALFCGLLCALIKSITALASLSVLITVLDIFICPIFFDFYIQKTPQLFLPNAYYINSVHSNDYFRYSLIYMAVLACMTLCLYVRKRKQ